MKINNIIREELKTLLNEGQVMEHENLKFHQQIKNSSFYNYQNFSNDYDIDITESDIIINWRVGFELNEFGIIKFLVQGDNVQGTYKVFLLDKQTDEVSQEINKEISEYPWRFQIDNARLDLNSNLYVDTLSFDFQTKICNITFFDQDIE